MNTFNLQAQKILIEAIFQHIPQYIFWKDAHSIYLGCNDKYASLLGLEKPEDIIGKTDDTLGWLPDGDTAHQFRIGDQQTLHGKYLTNAEEWLSLPNGKKVLALVNKVPLLDDNGKIFGVLGVATDITEKRKVEENLARTRHQLKGMTIVSASIAHELRTPLATIKNAIVTIDQLLPKLMHKYKATGDLASTDITPSQLDLLQTVLNSLKYKVDQANQIINMLLINIGDCHNGKQLTKEKCSARKCIDRALSEYIFPTHKPIIIWNEQHDFIFYAKEILIVHVLFNLLKNAIYFIHKAGKGDIHIWIEHTKNHHMIHFKDTGLGVKPAYLPHLFEPFFTAETNQGTGIGLAFCRTVLSTYGASINCQSVYGSYTEFTLIFPIKHEPKPMNKAMGDPQRGETPFSPFSKPMNLCHGRSLTIF